MNLIIQHTPAFVDRDGPNPRAEFSTLEDLERVPFVACWKADKEFVRFSRSDDYLMAEMSTPPIGKFWVVGRVKGIESLGLPEWKETEAQRLRREAWNRGSRS